MPVAKKLIQLCDISEADRARFLSKIIPPKNPNEDCWEIDYRSTNKWGHKRFSLKGRVVFCHYFSWRIFNPNLEDSVDLEICHNCDNNPGCVNPAHLRLDTHKSNSIDMAMAGNCTNQKLNPETIQEIRKLLAEGKLSHKQIGDRFDVKQQAISKIKTGIRWDHLENEEGIALPRKGFQITNKLNPEKVQEIRKLLTEGKLSQREIAKRFDVKQQAISKIKTGKRWCHVQ